MKNNEEEYIVRMTLRVKEKHNPPKFGKCNEKGVLATQDIIIKKGDREKYGDNLYYGAIHRRKLDLLEDFMEVTTEEIKTKKNGKKQHIRSRRKGTSPASKRKAK